jgi:hypothetical protein
MSLNTEDGASSEEALIRSCGGEKDASWEADRSDMAIEEVNSDLSSLLQAHLHSSLSDSGSRWGLLENCCFVDIANKNPFSELQSHACQECGKSRAGRCHAQRKARNFI